MGHASYTWLISIILVDKSFSTTPYQDQVSNLITFCLICVLLLSLDCAAESIYYSLYGRGQAREQNTGYHILLVSSNESAVPHPVSFSNQMQDNPLVDYRTSYFTFWLMDYFQMSALSLLLKCIYT
jgi:hypothetical protein